MKQITRRLFSPSSLGSELCFCQHNPRTGLETLSLHISLRTILIVDQVLGATPGLCPPAQRKGAKGGRGVITGRMPSKSYPPPGVKLVMDVASNRCKARYQSTMRRQRQVETWRNLEANQPGLSLVQPRNDFHIPGRCFLRNTLRVTTARERSALHRDRPCRLLIHVILSF